MAEFRYVGRHADTLGDGRTVAPGDMVDLDPNDETNDRLVQEGKLVQVVGNEGPRARRQGSTDTEEASS